MSEAVNTPETPKLDPIAAAIAKAKKAAEESVETQGENVPATQTQSGSAPAPAPAPATLPAGRPPALTMGDMKAGNITVDGWIGVKEFGFIFGPEKTLYPEMLTVQIDLTAVAICFAIKAGNPAQYWKSYDGVHEARGGAWTDAIAKANRINPDARQYRSAEIPMTLLEDIKIKDKVLHTKGQVLGHSLSTTNWGQWEKFYETCRRNGVERSTVIAVLNFEKRTNKAANVWGVVTFTLALPEA